MKKLKILSLVMVVVVLVPLLLSCSKTVSKDIKVKETDPWYESVRFELESERLPTEMYESSAVGYGNGKIFHVYNLTNLADYDNYRRAFLDIYRSEGLCHRQDPGDQD